MHVRRELRYLWRLRFPGEPWARACLPACTSIPDLRPARSTRFPWPAPVALPRAKRTAIPAQIHRSSGSGLPRRGRPARPPPAAARARRRPAAPARRQAVAPARRQAGARARAPLRPSGAQLTNAGSDTPGVQRASARSPRVRAQPVPMPRNREVRAGFRSSLGAHSYSSLLVAEAWACGGDICRRERRHGCR